ncbi:50S ribosomal protein L11 methyltransferase [Eisenibacter elegans]|uniref:50S ribosomal protein L11 methyltransferase n=1 Tax=Eisenibacter elegans TaxID=997 RepID=UPI0003FE897C|nr:50S ribosomal protein L11 methyltransferase [Eisenibacter elegans]
MEYTAVYVTAPADFVEILMAELAELGFETFVETEQGLEAYIVSDLFDASALALLQETYTEQATWQYRYETIAQQNWNEDWEKHYEPITVGTQCRVRASFHAPDPSFAYELLINPKMSFGTGHHETTALMLEHQLALDHSQKSVLDAGSGTGILAIMAMKLRATWVEAYDIEEWAAENARENAQLNDCEAIQIYQGTIETLSLRGGYDILLANINRNVLLAEIPAYVRLLRPGATVLLSGFYVEDEALISEAMQAQGWKPVSIKEKNRWVAVRYEPATR